MRTVYKYPLSGYVGVVELPKGKFLPVLADIQNDTFCVWCEVDLEGIDPDEYVTVRWQVFGTGQIVPSDAQHIGSFQDGQFVWHVYQEILD